VLSESKGQGLMSRIREQLLDGISSENFLDIATSLFQGDWENRTEVAKEVAALHNEGIVDALAEFLNLKNGSKNHRFFITRHIFEDAFPYLEAPVVDVMKCVKHLTKEAGQDMTAGVLISPFIDFCTKNFSRPQEALELAIEDHDQWKDFISPAIIAGARISLKDYVNHAIELSQNQSEDISSSAVLAMGRIDYSDDLETVTNVVKALMTVVNSSKNDQIFASVLKTAFAMYKNDRSKKPEIIEILSITLNNPGDATLHSASEILFFEKTDLPDFVIDLLLPAFEHVNPEYRGTLDNLDYGLEYLLKGLRGNQAIILIESLLLKHGREFPLTAFDSLSSEIVKNHNGILSWTITRWLKSDEITLGRSSIELIQENIGKKSELSADLTQLDKLNVGLNLRLAKRACGWFFYKPVYAVSYMMSLIELSSEDEVRKISDIIFNPLLISYPGSVKSYLSNLPENTPEKNKGVSKDLLKRLEEYHDGLRSAQAIKELEPSIAHREAYARKINKEMSASYKEAQKGYFLSHLFGKQSVLLYGNSSIYYIQHGPKGEATRHETPLQSINASIEFPSLEHLDPHSLELMLLDFKLEGYRG